MRKSIKAVGTLLLAGLFLTGCAGQSVIPLNDVPETKTETEAVRDVLRETVPETLPETETQPEETEPPEPVYPTGEQLAAGIAALPDSDVLRQDDIADVITAANLDTLPGEMREQLADALRGCESLTAYRTAFHRITGYTFHAWRDILQGVSAGNHTSTPYTDGSASLVFTGDVCVGDE